jgi:hypothetical protein
MEKSSENVIEIKKKPARRKYFIAAGIIFLCIFTGLIYRTMTWESKPDTESEAKIRQEVAKKLFLEKGLTIEPNNLTDEDFTKVNFLTLGTISFAGESTFTQELADIKLVEKCTNLQGLNLNDIKFPKNKIPKLVSLMAILGFFNLEEKFPLDLSPLEKLTNLETLSISEKSLKNFKTLENLTNLKDLCLSGKAICNIESVNKLTKLKTLFISDTQITDLDPLRGLNNLQMLIIYDTQITDIEPLRELNNLQELHIYNTPLANLEPIKGLTNLQKLKLHGSNNISDEQVDELQKALPTLRISR